MAEISAAPRCTEENEGFSGLSRREEADSSGQKHRDTYVHKYEGAQGAPRREDEELRKRLPGWLFLLEEALEEAAEDKGV